MPNNPNPSGVALDEVTTVAEFSELAPGVHPEDEDDFPAAAPPTEKPEVSQAASTDEEAAAVDARASKKAKVKNRVNATGCFEEDGSETADQAGHGGSATSKYPCPPGFRFTSGGLESLHFIGSGDKSREEWVQVCRPIRVLAQVAEGKARSYVIRYRDDKRTKQEHVLPAQDITDPKKLEALFAELGIGRGSAIKDLPDYFRGLTFHNLLPVGTLTKKLGWNGPRYMLPTGPVTPAGFEGEPIFLASTSGIASLKTKGSMEIWQQEVAMPIAHSSRLMFSVCAALASTMMTPLRIQTGGFNLVGESSEGKSTCMETAVSVWGAPEFILSWQATPVGMEMNAVIRNDTPMILDEQGLADAKELGKGLYHLCSGSEKLRGTKDVSARPLRTWTTMLLSTSEKSVADKMEEAGVQVQAGQEARLVHIPCRPPGKTQAIERWDGFKSSEALVKHLRFAVGENYGHAAPAFIKILVNYQKEDWDLVKARMSEWVERNTPKDAVPQVRRVADRFALVAVAGEIAIQADILPWELGTASWAAVECFQSWLQYRGGAGSSETSVASRGLLAFLTKHDARFAPTVGGEFPPVRDLAGWYKTEGGGKTYFVTPAALKEAVKGVPSDRVVSALISDGLIERTDRKHDRHVGQCQVYVAGIGRPWVYKITATAREAYEARERGLPPPERIPAMCDRSVDDIDDVPPDGDGLPNQAGSQVGIRP